MFLGGTVRQDLRSLASVGLALYCRVSVHLPFASAPAPLLTVRGKFPVHLQSHPAVAWQPTAGRICSSESLQLTYGFR